MAEDKLSGFKIGDKKRAEVRASQRPKAEDGSEETPSAGFESIESRLESGTIDSVAGELRGSYEKLETLSTEAKDQKTKAAAKKALAAYERTADLFEYLFATKDAIGQKKA